MIQEITEILQKQKQNFVELHEITIKKQQALSSSDSSMIIDVINKEERILMSVQSIERQRKESIVRLASKLGIVLSTNRSLKVSELLQPRIEKDQLIQIISIENAIRELALDIKKINQRNMFLIKLMRRFIDDLMTALIGNKQRVLVDRKV